MSALDEARRLAAGYAAAHAELAALLAAVEDRVREVKRGEMPAIKRAAGKAGRRRDKLVEHARAHPELFARPRSMTWENVRFGWRRQPGRVVIVDREAAIAEIESDPELMARGLLKKTTSILLDPCRRLTGELRRRLGVHVSEGADAPYANVVDSDIEKMVDAYLRDAAADAAGGAD